MKIEISDDCIDEIMSAELIETYKQLRKDLKNPTQWHEDDRKAFQDVFDALNIVGPFYVFDWKKKTK
jgi:hypothetical protein